jgi:hypothetical protein
LSLKRIDSGHRATVLLEQPVVAAAEYFGEEISRHLYNTGLLAHCWETILRYPF